MSDSGPLHGVRVVELAGLGPSQHGAMLLADLGADVVRVDRPADGAPDRDAARRTLLNRGRRSIALDLKDGDDREVALRLAEGADVLVDPYRPGVLERLGLGPDVLVARNPRLVVARMTGWGQDGPRAGDAGQGPCMRSAPRPTFPWSRSTSSPTSAAAGCCSRSASPRRSSSASARGAAR
jgi:alpha-methylacyl-CoA racemase